MIAAVNYVAVPYFEQLPPQAGPAVCRAWEAIARLDRSAATDGIYMQLCIDLDRANCRKPEKAEFARWQRDIRAGLVVDPLGMFDVVEMCSVGSSAKGDVERIDQAIRVVAAGHALAEAKLAAGYDAMCVQSQDDLVCEAIKDLLIHISEVGQQPLHPPREHSPMMVALDLLEPFASDTMDRLLDAIVTEFGAELCAALAVTFTPTTGVAA